MSRVTNIEQFKELKRQLIAKWGERLIHYSGEELKQLEVDCTPLAKYAKMPWERIHMALVNTFLEENPK